LEGSPTGALLIGTLALALGWQAVGGAESATSSPALSAPEATAETHADMAPEPIAPSPASPSSSMPVVREWRTFTEKDGLPSNKVYAVRVGEDRVWVGTDAGVAYYKDGRWDELTVADGLAHNVVLAIDVNEETGDVWFGTAGGLNRWSAGRLETFNQLNSGLANDVVYAVSTEGEYLWVATAAGAGRLNTYTGRWDIFNEQNAPMHEPWTYGVHVHEGVAYIAAWGGGVLEYDSKTGQWRDHVDPDGEMEIDLFPDDGVVHDITTGVSRADGILWVGTYFGLSRYDGVRWRGYFDHDSGLVSNFINFLRARGPVVWVCTDKGLNAFNGTTWVTYRRDDETGRGEVLISDSTTTVRRSTPSGIAHNYVLGVDLEDDRVWVATARGLSLGSGVEETSDFLARTDTE
jgi:ligand-binding sensor domain-containing protein